ncbi:hypothetical protein POSPLADRAFT_1160107 [Postia placenta MAD-698-R-SB12]|uniref:Carboxypeptidase n=1 Tax=Postia placenta MAD-698-R-SB12 TaxID=670580 RepID=A0A1X6MJ40_9APHY|nr:hypothetical protein POSPLADRAFT_1160107 [Postia placenta MAD-698-R-SB12]OSX56451.1 hypothetical protein POSPLADRAFT_1160107 [Postia placenta MAD-698-R-SB12]
MFSTDLLTLFVAVASVGGALALQRPFSGRSSSLSAGNNAAARVQFEPVDTISNVDAFTDYDAGLFTPLEDLTYVLSGEFTSLNHPTFPKYSVRIKKSDFCDGTVGAYTGYIDVEARHLFFYFFESRRDPDKDDVIFWTNGGPGCSSSLGLFMELDLSSNLVIGPCRVTSPDNMTYNPYSWNEQANIFFIDQPVGVGFSYADYGESVNTTPEAAKDIAAFVAIFFEHFSKFKGRAFHMAGESYGGRYIPVFAAEVYDQNVKLVDAGMTPINLSSIMIGNGCTDDLTMLSSYYDMQCRPMSVPPIQDIASCIRMKQALPRCEKWFTESCRDQFDSIGCEAANVFCYSEIAEPFDRTGYNPYDISQFCDGTVEDTLCYPVTKAISTYLDRPDVRSTIGADPSFTGNFSGCSDAVGMAFYEADDSLFPTQFYIAALLERGIRALIYVGANDWICNWVGNERMTLALEWSGQQDFAAEPLRGWKVDGDFVGLTRTAGPLTFVTIDGAGHMVPYDKPKHSLELVTRWLSGSDL